MRTITSAVIDDGAAMEGGGPYPYSVGDTAPVVGVELAVTAKITAIRALGMGEGGGLALDLDDGTRVIVPEHRVWCYHLSVEEAES